MKESDRRAILSAIPLGRAGCCQEVARDHELQPCERPAVALRRADSELGEGYTEPYPVCAYHTRVGQCVTLAEITEALWGMDE